MDEELAELFEDLETGSKKPPVIHVSEMTPETQMLRDVVALLRSLVQAQSPKRIQFPPLPTPRTARQLLAERRRAANRGLLLERVAEAQARWARDHPEDTPPG